MALASHAPIFFGSGTALISESSRIASQRQCVRKGHLCASKAQRSFFFKRPALYTFVMAGEKSIGKALLLDGFLSYLDSRTNQTPAVLLEKIGPPFTSLHVDLRVGHKQTDTLTDGRGPMKTRPALGPTHPKELIDVSSISWKRHNPTSRLTMFTVLVLPVLLYNCGL